MRIAVFGLGYVGVVSAACLARDGHHVVGVDLLPEKIETLRAGRSPIIEPGVDALIAAATSEGRMTATDDTVAAIDAADVSLVCVGTPSSSDGALDTTAVASVAAQIGAAIGRVGRPHLVVMRSTVLPGTTRQLVAPALERGAGRRLGDGFRLAYNPEFLREATAVSDFDNPPKTVVGAMDQATAEETLAIYGRVGGPKIATGIEVAEMAKYADNIWHAAKVCFANEIGNLASALGVDPHAVMDVFVEDRKLNISPAYLRPGFAFGGSCLPKDIRAMLAKGREIATPTPMIASLLETNRHQVARARAMIADYGVRRLSLLGVSFKAGTDDMRESPQLALLKALLCDGYDVAVYDGNVREAQLIGANRAYVAAEAPEIRHYLRDDLADVVAYGDLVVVGNGAAEFKAAPAMMNEGQRMFDLVGLPGAKETLGARYRGVNW